MYFVIPADAYRDVGVRVTQDAETEAGIQYLIKNLDTGLRRHDEVDLIKDLLLTICLKN